MRTEQEMLDLILTYAKNNDNIRAVVLNGSRANPNAPKDIFQDFDIACLVNDVKPYMRNKSIPPRFGEILILQEPEDMQEPPAENDGRYTYLMQFKDGNRIDLSFDPPELFKPVIDDSLTVVLLDKDGILNNVPPSSDRDYLPKPPTAKQFGDCCNEFWWVSVYVAKGLWRNELTNAKHIQDVYVREQLMKMLVWYFGIKTNFQKAAGKSGKYIRGNVESEVWVELEKTYSDADFEHIWESLFAMGDLFRQLAKSVANHFGFQYHQQEDDNVSDYTQRGHKLRFFKGGKAQIVTVGIISAPDQKTAEGRKRNLEFTSPANYCTHPRSGLQSSPMHNPARTPRHHCSSVRGVRGRSIAMITYRKACPAPRRES